jgi:HPt (histidine-containing phosphotransfer) domain-containing protein
MSAAGAQVRPVDLVHLARYTGGDMALNAEILGLFLNQTTQLIGQLHGALEEHDQKTWREILHSLKGAARGIGAFGMADAAAAAEPIALGDSTAARALEDLKLRARPVQVFIEAYLGR